ncbi:MAG: HD domain-containing protein [Desulfobacteraceae bacterium]|nr:HD domain-containing protein [Desulfobacteraceae bacterium]MBC2756686.1 HD domain-containing protein [Desulfobacteraceae bacterium]
MEKYSSDSLDKLSGILDYREADLLADFATRSTDGIRRFSEKGLASDYRQNFAVDVDRILHSMAYTRYIDKTQVFYLIKNDHITHRMLHVQLVSRVARTIGRFLGLNEDLIEAIAIGHDIGHPPFGHDGERILSKICTSFNIGGFHHNVQSVHFLEKVERKGRGWNLCLQTLDGILCHDGEIHNLRVEPISGKKFSDLESEIEHKKSGDPVSLIPMSLEGCVVRFSDTVSYIGRDIEDAIRLGLINRSELPQESMSRLGDTNGKIVYSLVTDILLNSSGKPYVSFSPEVSDALKLLKKFNYDRIYMNPVVKKELSKIERLFKEMFSRFLDDITEKRISSPVFKNFIDGMSDDYMAGHCPAEVIRDFIAGMTDQYFLRQSPEALRPRPISL